MMLTRSESEELGKRVVHFFENIANRDKSLTYSHFIAEGISKSTIHGMIGRYLDRGTSKSRKKSGRPRSVATKEVVGAIEKAVKNNPNLSVRDGSAKLSISKSTYGRVKVQDLGIKAYRKESVPKYTGDQAERAKTACRRIYRKRLLTEEPTILIIDDETYVPVDRDQIPGVEYYHCKEKGDVPDQNRFKRKEKFFKKFLVWQAIDEFGNVSDPFVSTGTVNGEVYLKECLKKRLMPFIQKYHQNSKVLFWMDMASSHYKKEVTDWLTAQGIDFVGKKENAPNVPQARPIEKFWALSKAEYKRHRRTSKSLASFRKIWKKISTKVAEESAQALMKEARRYLRSIGYGYVYSPIKMARK